MRGHKSGRDLNPDSFFTAGASEVNLQFSYPKCNCSAYSVSGRGDEGISLEHLQQRSEHRHLILFHG